MPHDACPIDADALLADDPEYTAWLDERHAEAVEHQDAHATEDR